eukprot:ctg_2322.g753
MSRACDVPSESEFRRTSLRAAGNRAHRVACPVGVTGGEPPVHGQLTFRGPLCALLHLTEIMADKLEYASVG